MFGHERLTSIKSGFTALIVVAIVGKSSSHSPAILAMIGFPSTFNSGISAAYASYPRFGRPMELMEPPGNPKYRGVGLPSRGSIVIDLVTMAPARDRPS